MKRSELFYLKLRKINLRCLCDEPQFPPLIVLTKSGERSRVRPAHGEIEELLSRFFLSGKEIDRDPFEDANLRKVTKVVPDIRLPKTLAGATKHLSELHRRQRLANPHEGFHYRHLQRMYEMRKKWLPAGKQTIDS